MKDNSKKIKKMFAEIEKSRVNLDIPASLFIAVYALIKEVNEKAKIDKDLKIVFEQFLKELEPMYNKLIPDASMRIVITINPNENHERN